MGFAVPASRAVKDFAAIRSAVAKDEAQRLYDDAFETHATAEQLAVFWSEFSEAKTHRDALQLILERGEQELNAQPFVKGAWT